MGDFTVLALKEWESFYVIVGSSAGALTGLQFVVMTLIVDSEAIRRSSQTMAAFGSPNVVHFCLALLVAALCSAPWHDLGPLGVFLGMTGAAGFGYCVIVLRRARRQRGYKPVLEDWIWHTVIPMLAYLALIPAGILLAPSTIAALYMVGATALLLVFVGIHNAWDTVMYVTLLRMREQKAKPSAGNT